MGRRRSTTSPPAIALRLGSDVPFFLGPAARRSSRAAASSSLRSTVSTARPACSSSRRPWRSRPPTSSRRSTPSVATAIRRSGCRRRTSPKNSVEVVSRRSGRPGRRPRIGERPPPGDRARRSRPRPLPASAQPSAARPLGLSGSGPTLWALYPSSTEAEAAAEVVREARSTGTITPPGDGDPTVIATSIVQHHDQHQPWKETMTRRAVSTAGAPAAIGPNSQAIAIDGLLFAAGQAGRQHMQNRRSATRPWPPAVPYSGGTGRRNRPDRASAAGSRRCARRWR